MVIYGTIEIDGRTMARAKSDRGKYIVDGDGRYYADAVYPAGDGRTFTESEIDIDDEVPMARRWSRLSIKTALAQAGMLAAARTYLSATDIADGYTAWEALTDCDYIEEGFGGTEKWNALLDGAANALGKTREEIDAFLNTIPTEGRG